MTATRSELVSAIRERLRRASLPHFQMLIVVTLTGLSGFLGSAVLLHWHLRAMWLRYGLCVALAYLIFFLLLRLWIYHQGRRASDVTDLLEQREALFDVTNPSGANRSSDRGWLDWIDFDLPDLPDLDEGLVFVASLVAIASALVACGYVIYSAPSLFAEILVDGILSGGLYHRMRNLQPRHWFGSVLRRTGIPFALVALFFVVAGGVSQRYAPEAVSIGGVLRHYSTSLQHHRMASDGLRSK